VRAGQGDRQFDQPEGGRGQVPGTGARVPGLWRGGGGDGLRQAGPGRHRQAQDRDLRAGLSSADGESRFPARGHHLRPQHLRGGDGHRGARQLRRRLHRGDAGDQADPALRSGLRRGLQRLLQLPRQRAGAPGDPLGVPVPRGRGRHGHGHRQRRRVAALRRHRPSATRGGRGRDPEPPPQGRRQRHRAAGRAGPDLQGRQGPGQGPGPGLALAAGGRAAEPRPGARKPGSPPSGRCT